MRIFYLLFLVVSIAISGACGGQQRLPNGSFEHWTSVGGQYENPDLWSTNNTAVFTGVAKDSTVKLDSMYSMQVRANGSATSPKFRIGYDWLVCHHYNHLVNSDTCRVTLYHYHANGTSDSIVRLVISPASSTGWSTFIISSPSAVYNDSAIVKIEGGHNAGTTINFDHLFHDREGITDVMNGARVAVIPNPVRQSSFISFSNPAHQPYDCIIANAAGKAVIAMKDFSGDKIPLSCAGLASGAYFWQLRNLITAEVAAGKIVVE